MDIPQGTGVLTHGQMGSRARIQSINAQNVLTLIDRRDRIGGEVAPLVDAQAHPKATAPEMRNRNSGLLKSTATWRGLGTSWCLKSLSKKIFRLSRKGLEKEYKRKHHPV